MLKIINVDQVTRLTGLSYLTIRRLEKEGDFPARRQISAGRIGWIDQEINDWMEASPQAYPAEEDDGIF